MGVFDRWRGSRARRHDAALPQGVDGTGRMAGPDQGRRVPDPDPVFPVLSRERAGELVALAHQSFAEHGRETVYDGNGALVGQGHVHGLGNLAALAAQTPPRQWPGLVDRHVVGMLTAYATPDPTGLDEARDLLLPKIRLAADIPQPLPDYAPEVLPGVVALAALDYPTHVSELLADARVDELGGWGVVREVAWENLRRLPAPTVSHIQAGPDAPVLALTSSDFFGASRLLVLDEVLAGLGVERPTHGVLVAVPHRHLMLVHVLEGPGVVAALGLMSRSARAQWESEPGPVSPEVYYRDARGRAEQVTRAGGEPGRVDVLVTGAFEEAMRALGLLG